MVDVGEKTATRRRAVAEGTLRMAPATLRQVQEQRLPKGDALALAEVAGILAAKKASELLPLCHPLPLDSLRVRCAVVEPDAIRVECEAIATAKTGVEMEALAGVQGALLAIYDLVKGVDAALAISDVFLRTKEGGKSGSWTHPRLAAGAPAAAPDVAPTLRGVRVAVLTVSDRCARGDADESGPAVASFVLARAGELAGQEVVADDRGQIQSAIRSLIAKGSDLVLATGGTGLGPRDVTPAALAELWTKRVPGFGERLRESGARHTPLSWLSRSEAGLVGETLVILLPGSPKAVREGLAAIEALIPHALHVARGGGHGRP